MEGERRAAGGEVRVSGGRTLIGTAMLYGDVSPSFRERFLPGAFGEVRAIDLNLQHDPGVVLVRGATLTDSPRALSVSATLAEGAAALQLVCRRALNSFSVEFKPKKEHRDASGIRVVEMATLTGLALVDRGAFSGAVAEVRARSGRTLRSKIPYDAFLACECIKREGAGSGGTCIPMVRFSKMAGEEMAAAFGEADRRLLAVAGNYKRPLASSSRGTVRATSTDDALVVEIDLPSGSVADEVVAAHEAAGLVVRPLIDPARSEFVDTDKGREYTRPFLRALIVGSTDAREGWPDAEITYDGEGRAAPERRRRIWL